MFSFLYLSSFLFLAGLTAALLVVLSISLSVQNPSPLKLTPYECGFDSLGDARQQFEVQFFLVGLLFLIFDLEIVFLFPWVASFASLFSSSLFIIFSFLLILTSGFIYEWFKGALDWE